MPPPLTSNPDRDEIFSLPLQINYEDTDAAGVVYYANYLGYMERARNACLRRIGFSPTAAQAAAFHPLRGDRGEAQIPVGGAAG